MSASTELEAIKLQNVGLKGLISDYALRTKQAEQMTQALMNEKFDKDQLIQVMTAMLNNHVNERTKERLVHHQALLQATYIALCGFIPTTSSSSEIPEVYRVNKKQLVEIIESLRLSI